MTGWRQDGSYFLWGITLTLIFFGAALAIGGLLVLLLSVAAPASIREGLQAISQPLQVGLLLIALVEVIAWNLLPLVGFADQRLARRMAVVMAAILLFMAVSLLFSL